jgi:hypothetical protein
MPSYDDGQVRKYDIPMMALALRMVLEAPTRTEQQRMLSSALRTPDIWMPEYFRLLTLCQQRLQRSAQPVTVASLHSIAPPGLQPLLQILDRRQEAPSGITIDAVLDKLRGDMSRRLFVSFNQWGVRVASQANWASDDIANQLLGWTTAISSVVKVRSTPEAPDQASTLRWMAHDSWASEEATWSTGLPTLDDALQGGLRPNQTTLVEGNTGAGKTVMGVQLWAQMLAHGLNAEYVTMEVPAKDISARLAAHICSSPDITYSKIKRHQLTAGAGADLDRQLGVWQAGLTGALHLREPAAGTTTLDDVQRWIEEDQLQSMILDHLLLMRQDNRVAEWESVCHITQGLFEIAKSTGCHIIMLGQTNADGMMAGSKRAEWAANNVLSWYSTPAQRKDKYPARACLSKARDGVPGYMYLTLDPESQRFIDVPETDPSIWAAEVKKYSENRKTH